MPALPRRRSTLGILTATNHAEAAEEHEDRALPSATTMQTSLSDARSHSTHDDLSKPASLVGHSKSPPLLSTKAAQTFTMRLSRHFSDSHLAARAKMYQEQEQAPPMPRPFEDTNATTTATSTVPVSSILVSAPTLNAETPEPREPRRSRAMPFKRQKSKVDSIKSKSPSRHLSPDKEQSRSIFQWSRKPSDTTINPLKRFSMLDGAADQAMLSPGSPTLHSLDAESLSAHMTRGSSSPKDKRPGMFSLSRRDKRKSLFPLPPKVEPPLQYPDTAPATPRGSMSASTAVHAQSLHRSPSPIRLETTKSQSVEQLRSVASCATMNKGNVSFAPSGNLLERTGSNRSVPSMQSNPSLPFPRRLGVRDRANTGSTFGRKSEDVTPPTPPTLNGSTRNSTSTTGRASLGGFLTLSRFRNSETNTSRHDSTGFGSKPSSLSIARESVSLPDRGEGETAAKYLERLQSGASRNIIAGMLAKSTDPFFHTVLRSYTRRFAFFGEPIDMSLRKFLLEAELPKETQQVDRVIQAFADRYHECNPGIFKSPDQAYIIAFSLMMLHTDAFNRNNKYKMQKADYIKNTRGQHVSEDVLACFYDNICYTPFIHFDEDDFDAGSDRLSTFKSKKAKLRGAMPDPNKKSSSPVDPYYLIIENKLDVLRPSLKDTIVLDDPYNYLGTAKSFDLQKIQWAFHGTGRLQIISARSRPAAFESQETRENPAEAKPGVVELQVTKVGVLWRKSTKRKKTRSPWSEWGAILTGSQLFFFKNVSWVKGLMQQYHTHQKHMVPPSPVIFKPPLEDFRPDALIKTDNAVALIDGTYTRHKNAFTMVQHGGEEEILLADNESELNEWLALINYAATFRSAGVRIRGFVVADKTAGAPPPLRRANTSRSTQMDDKRASNNPLLARQILAARRQQMVAKIAEAEIKMSDIDKQLDDMLRNARHLLLLAPVQPKSRDVIIHSAARMDAMLKWTRRDMWRTKCYKDILYMDALEDSNEIKDEAARLRPLTLYQPAEPSTTFEDGVRIVNTDVDGSTTSATTASRPPTRSSEVPLPEEDIFRTPPESTRNTEDWSWKLTPMDLNQQLAAINEPQRQPSISSAVTSSASVRPPSITQTSTASSSQDLTRLSSGATPVDRILSVATVNPVTPNSTSSRAKRDPLVHMHSTITTTSTRRQSDTPPVALHQATPDSAPRTRSHRKSLHRSLRDGLHDSGGSIHRHRKGKESASTVKSEGSQDGDDASEGTPGLERREGRFMLHGKHASVITFGESWNGGIRLPPSSHSERDGGSSHLSKVLTTDGIVEAPPAAEESGLETAAHRTSAGPDDGTEVSTARARGMTLDSITAHAAIAQAYADGATPRASQDSEGDTGVFWDARERDSRENLRRSIGGNSIPQTQGDAMVDLRRLRIGDGELRRLSAEEETDEGDATPRIG